MAHIMLPKSFSGTTPEHFGKFADTGIPQLIAQMEELGADRDRILLALVGGAKVRTPEGSYHNLDIGSRNAQAVLQVIAELELSCLAHDLGGSMSRSVTLASDSGKVVVRTISQGEDLLCNFRG